MSTPRQLALSEATVILESETDFTGWRDAARRLALANTRPEDVRWEVGDSRSFASSTPTPCPSPQMGGVGGGGMQQSSAPTEALKVPREFVDRAEAVICHSDPERFSFLYRMLWRLRVEPDLMHIASDPDIRRFEAMEKSVRRDIHKMRAFVRFRKISALEGDLYVAWFEPEHYIVERNAPFFVRRFTGMRWTIVTPYASAAWDGETLTIGPGGSRADVPGEDDAEALWLTYFSNIFNPARLKVKAMQAEMPKKYWRNLPEASLIPGMIAGADQAAIAMIERQASQPAPHHARVRAMHWDAPVEETMPSGTSGTLEELKGEAAGCRRCPLWQNATQTVFGEGPPDARIIFVGEQPGDQEDLAGLPFVGPAGKVFDQVLDDAEIDRQKVYVTNAVKHFKFEPRGKRRIHSKPNAGEVQACRWWLDRELALVQPSLAVALGATAALSLLGRTVAVTKQRGTVVTREDGLRVFLTIHPSFILRIPDPADKEAERARFLADMQAVKSLMAA